MNTLAASSPERYHLTLQATPDRDGVPAIIRLRRFLKMALRSYGLRCVKAECLMTNQVTAATIPAESSGSPVDVAETVALEPSK